MSIWTQKEIQFLIENYHDGKKEDLLLNLYRRSYKGILDKAEKLGLKRDCYCYWTNEEKKILQNNYYDGKKEDLMLNLYRHSWKGIQKKAFKLELKRKIRLQVDEDFFKVWTKEMAYIFGFWIADGWIFEKDNSIGFSSNDQDLLKIIKYNLKSEHKISKSHEKGYQLHIHNKIIYNDLLKLGGTPRKSLIIQFPEVPNEFLPDFIRGFMDGDGGVYFYNYYPSIRFTGNIDFLTVLKEKITEHVSIDTISFDIANKNDPNHSQRIYYLAYNGEKSIKLGDYIYKNSEGLRLERKFKNYEKAKIKQFFKFLSKNIIEKKGGEKWNQMR